jgi:hypothetical protein
MTDHLPTGVTLRTPTDVLAAVPYLLGFHPSDSVVVIGLRRTRVVFNVRADLPVPGTDASVLAGQLADVLTVQGAERALVVGYGDAGRVTRAVLAVGEALQDRGVAVCELLRVADGRYWSYLCASPECCPAEGTPYDTAGTEIAAAATFAGRVVLPDRSTLERVLDPPVDLATLEAATDEAAAVLAGEVRKGGRRRVARRALGAALRAYRAGDRLDGGALARLVVLVAELDVRDLAWQRILTDGDDLDPHVDLWRDATRHARPDLAAAPATLLAVAAWRAGDGALAWVALDRAFAIDPAYSLARLLAEALTHALPPSVMDDLVPPSTLANARRRRCRVDYPARTRSGEA